MEERAIHRGPRVVASRYQPLTDALKIHTSRYPPPPPKFSVPNQQVRDFASEVVGKPVFLVCNSVGGLAGLQAGVDAPEQVMTTWDLFRTTNVVHRSAKLAVGALNPVATR